MKKPVSAHTKLLCLLIAKASVYLSVFLVARVLALLCRGRVCLRFGDEIVCCTDGFEAKLDALAEHLSLLRSKLFQPAFGRTCRPAKGWIGEMILKFVFVVHVLS